MGVVDVKRTSADELTIEWDSTACNDMIADSTLALVAGVDQSPASLQFTTLASLRAHPHARLLRDSSQQLQRIVWFLEAHFGEVNLDITTEADRALDVDVTQSFILSVRSGEVVAYIKTDPTAVTCVDDMVKSRVEDVINMAILTTYPLSDLFDTSECMHR
ncbi:hypothetical protein ID866_2469 [Astraeus odoratus]|nr:hypothetical protein ID866_2469 [Astraeus odoratus]